MPKQTIVQNRLDTPPAGVGTRAKSCNASDRQESKSESAVLVYTRIAKHWGLDSREAASLLGVSTSNWIRMRSRPEDSHLSEQLLARFGDILRIYIALHIIFEDEIANAWMQAENGLPLFQGQSPVQAMITGGTRKIMDVRDHLDAASVGL